MSDLTKHNCGQVTADELMLYAYGESEDERVNEHARSCPACRGYLESIGAVREVVARAEFLPARARTVAAIKTKAAWELTSKPRPEEVPSGWWSPRSWAPALAAAMIALIIGVAAYLAYQEPAAKDVVADNELPEYLAGSGRLLLDLAAAMDESVSDGATTASIEDGESLEDQFVLDPGLWSEVTPALEGIDEVELAMLGLEYSMGMSDDNEDDHDTKGEIK